MQRCISSTSSALRTAAIPPAVLHHLRERLGVQLHSLIACRALSMTNVPLRLHVSALAELKPLAHRLAFLPACLGPGTTEYQCSAYNVPYFVSSCSDSSDHSPGKE